jgi:crotonobetainyl-CoA:carnitine CoA-transferase CaiB-like acyl-CoA transferase
MSSNPIQADAPLRNQRLPLEGIKVLELSHIVAGPSGGMMLGDLGAEVIKIEHPRHGDTARNQNNDGATFYTFNRNKKYLALDLQKPEGKQVFERLVSSYDVVLDNFAPGALERLGLDYEWGSKVNPRIIYCSVKGFLPGPYGDRPFLDELAQMAGGLAYLTGFKDQPMRAGASITDIGAATYAVIGILAALHRRNLTGRGESIEAGLYETIVFWISQYITGAQIKGANPPPRGEHSTMAATMGWGVYQLFRTSDERQVFIAVTANRHWGALCEVLGFDDWKDAAAFNSNKKRSLQKPRIAERIAPAVARFSFEDICARLYGAGIPHAPVNTPMDLLDERHLAEAGRWLELQVPGRRFKVPKLPLDFRTTTDFEVRNQPDSLGHDSDHILAGLGYSAGEIERLKVAGAVLTSDRMLNVESNDP